MFLSPVVSKSARTHPPVPKFHQEPIRIPPWEPSGFECDQVTETWYFGDDGKIYAAWDTSMCIDVAGTNSTTNGKNVQLWQCDQDTETWDGADAMETPM